MNTFIASSPHTTGKMFSTTSLLTFVTIALSVTAKPAIVDRSSVLSVSLTRIQNLSGEHNLVEAGLIRAQSFKDHIAARDLARDLGGLRKRQSVPVTNNAVQYTASVGVGEPATQCE